MSTLKFNWKSCLALIAAIALGIGLILMLHETGKVIRAQYASYLWIWAPIVLLLWALLKNGAGNLSVQPLPRALRPAVALVLLMMVALGTGWIEHRWFYFLRWNQPTWPHIWTYSTMAMAFFILTALLTPALLRPRKVLNPVLWVLLLLCMVHCLWTLGQHTGWDLLVRDDHPSFAFRIWKLSEVLPRLESYVPFWNAGSVQSYALDSGAIGPSLLMYPFIKWFSIEQVYTPAVGVLFIVVMPLLAVWAARIAGFRRNAQVAAGFLALCTTQFYYLWLAQYGTLGANFAAAFVMPFSACLYRALYYRDRSVRLGLYTVISAVFLIMWPPGAAMTGLVALGVLVNVRQWTWPTWRFLLICAGCVALIQWRQYLIILGADVWSLIPEDRATVSKEARAWSDILLAGIAWLRAHFRQAHPLLLFLGVAGAFVAPYRRVRAFYGPILIGMALLTMYGPELVPVLQLERMILPLLFAAVLPAALCIGYLLDTRGAQWALLRAGLVAMLIATALNAQRLWNNEGRARYQVMCPELKRMVEFIRDEVPEGSRLLFAGHTVHSYGGGHVAFLPYLTGREMMACDYYHFDPAQIEYNYPPRAWRDAPETIHEFIRLHNVSMITTRRDSWLRRLRAEPDRYEEIESFWDDRVTFFHVLDTEPSMFLEGNGRVHADFNRMEITLDEPRDEVVIRYNWHPRLRADSGVELFPYDVGRDVVFIGIRPQGVQEFTIRHPNRL